MRMHENWPCQSATSGRPTPTANASKPAGQLVVAAVLVVKAATFSGPPRGENGKQYHDARAQMGGDDSGSWEVGSDYRTTG